MKWKPIYLQNPNGPVIAHPMLPENEMALELIKQMPGKIRVNIRELCEIWRFEMSVCESQEQFVKTLSQGPLIFALQNDYKIILNRSDYSP